MHLFHHCRNMVHSYHQVALTYIPSSHNNSSQAYVTLPAVVACRCCPFGGDSNSRYGYNVKHLQG